MAAARPSRSGPRREKCVDRSPQDDGAVGAGGNCRSSASALHRACTLGIIEDRVTTDTPPDHVALAVPGGEGECGTPVVAFPGHLPNSRESLHGPHPETRPEGNTNAEIGKQMVPGTQELCTRFSGKLPVVKPEPFLYLIGRHGHLARHQPQQMPLLAPLRRHKPWCVLQRCSHRPPVLLPANSPSRTRLDPS